MSQAITVSDICRKGLMILAEETQNAAIIADAKRNDLDLIISMLATTAIERMIQMDIAIPN